MLGGASPAEMQQLASLLHLIRSGSPVVDSLLAATTQEQPVGTSVQQAEKKGSSGNQGKPVAQKTATGARPEDSGWQVQKDRKREKQVGNDNKEAATELLEVLSPSNSAFVASTGHLSRDKACFCLASKAEAERAVLELSSPLPMAILAPANIGNKGTEVTVLVKMGRHTTSWTRHLVQLGREDVVFDHSQVAKGGRVTDANVRVVVYGRENKCPNDVWKSLQSAPKAVVDAWLKQTAGLQEVGRLHKPRLVAETGELSVVAEVPPAEVHKGEASSGEGGLFFRRFVETEEERAQQRIVPLDTKHDRLAALRVAKTLPGVALGVVPTRKGWGIRVATAAYEQVLAEVNPDARETLAGSDYLVSGLPLSWGKSNVIFFLGDWEANPVGQPFRVGFRNTWTVRATREPPNKVLQNPDPLGLNVLASISLKEHRPKKAKTVLKQVQGPTKQSKQGLPRSWAQVTAPEKASRKLPQRPSGQAWGSNDVFVNGENYSTRETNTAPSQPGRGAARPSTETVPSQEHQQQPSTSAFPPDFMAQLQSMVQSAVRAAMQPVYAELEQVKAAADESTPMRAVAMDGSEEEEEDSGEEETPQLGAAPAQVVATEARRPAEPSGEPPSHRRSANSRSPRR